MFIENRTHRSSGAHICAVPALLFALLAAGCRDARTDPTGDAAALAEARITVAAGGELEVRDGARAGLRLEVPAGALAADEMVSAHAAADLAAGGAYQALGPAVELRPAGLAFARPAALSFPYPSAALSPEQRAALVVLRRAHAGAPLEALPPARLDRERVEAALDGFSFYQLAIAAGDFRIRPAPLRQGVAGVAYDESPAVAGGTPPVVWTLAAGALPPGLALDPAGRLAGTPTGIGTFAFTLAATETLSGGARSFNALPGLDPALLITARSVQQAFTVRIVGRTEFTFAVGREPAVAIDATDRACVVWSTSGVIGARRYAADGSPADPAALALSGGGLSARRPRVAAGPGGAFLAVWEEVADGLPRVRGRVLADDGSLGAEQTLADATAGARFPAVAGHESGWLLAWEALDRGPGGATESNVFVRLLDAQGAPAGDPLRADAFADGDSPGDGPDLAIAGTQALAVWTERGAPATGGTAGASATTGGTASGTAAGASFAPQTVYRRVFDLAAQNWIGPAAALAGAGDGASRPRAVAAGTGYAVAFNRLERVLLDENGNPWSAATAPPAGTPEAWDLNALLMIVDAAGAAGAPVRIDENPARASAYGPLLLVDDAGALTAIWTETVSDGFRALERQFDAAGQPQGAAVSLGFGRGTAAAAGFPGLTGSALLVTDGLAGFRVTNDRDAFVGPPALTEPAAVTGDASVALDWPDVFGATSYTVEWSENADFAALTGTADALTESAFTSPPFADGQRVFFRARATNAAPLTSVNSNVVSTLIDLTDPTVAWTAPAGGETFAAGSTPTLRWTTTDVNPARVTITLAGAAGDAAVATLIPDGGQFAWRVPAGLTGDALTLSITATDRAGRTGTAASAAFAVQ